MSSIKRYYPKQGLTRHAQTVHESVLAVKLTERNFVSVLNWAGKFDGFQGEAKIDVDKNGDAFNHRIKIKTPKGWRVVKVGEYLVRHFGYGKTVETSLYYFTVGKDEFLKNYELA